MERSVKQRLLNGRTRAKLERVREFIKFMIENPGLNRKQLALAYGVPETTVDRYLSENNILKALRGHASKKMLTMIPLAVQGFEDSITSNNAKIKYLASKDLLQSERILGPERVDVTIEDTSAKSVEELKQIIERAQKVPPQTIDAELIS